jgi:hypothetical protein
MLLDLCSSIEYSEMILPPIFKFNKAQVLEDFADEISSIISTAPFSF